MSEDLTLKIVADIADLKAALAQVVANTKQVGTAAKDAGDKASKSFTDMGRNVSLAFVGMQAFRLGVRALREGFQDLEKAAGQNSLVSGALKEGAMVANYEVKNLTLGFERFKETAVSALAPVIGFIAKDLSDGLRQTTKGLKDNSEMVENFANGWAVLKTVAVVVTETFNVFFQEARFALAGIIGLVGTAAKGFGYLAGVVSKEAGDSIKSFGDTLVNSAQEITNQAVGSMEKSGAKLGDALSGAMYDRTMKGFDKFKAGIPARAEEISLDVDATKKLDEKLASLKKISDERQKSLALAVSELPEIRAQREITEEILKLQKDEAVELEKKQRLKNADPDSMRLEELKANKAFMEMMPAVLKMKREEAYLDEVKAQANANYFDKIGKMTSGETPADTMKINQTEGEQEYFKARMELEMDFYTKSIEDANTYAEEIIAIDDYMNGTIREQQGRRRAQEILDEKKTSKLKRSTLTEDLGATSQALRDAQAISEAFGKKGFEAAKVFGIAAIGVETTIATMRAWSAGAAIDSKLGTPLVFASSFAALAVGAGMAQAAKLASQSYGSGASAGGIPGGSADAPTGSSNSGGPGGSGGTSTVNVSLIGERFGASQVRGLMDQIREESKDGKKLTRVNVL
jgi:hypothetical protein